MNLYFIALIIPEPFQTEITAFKNYFLERYNCKVALKSPAHITLIPPFKLKAENENQLLNLLEQFSSPEKNISISLNGFGCFTPRTIFVEPENSDALSKLFQSLHNYFSEKVLSITQQLKRKKDNLQPIFHPHVTVANRDMTKEQFFEAWLMFKDKEYKASFEQNSFCLLKHDGSKWNVLKEFVL